MKPRAMHFGAEEVDLRNVHFTEELLGRVPAHVARRYRLIPIQMNTDKHGWMGCETALAHLEGSHHLVILPTGGVSDTVAVRMRAANPLGLEIRLAPLPNGKR